MRLKIIFRRRVKRSCWKTNNEKNKVVVGLWKTSRNYEVKLCHSRKKNWIDMNKETRRLFHREDKRRTWIIILSPLIELLLRESFRWNITQDNSNEEIDGFPRISWMNWKCRVYNMSFQTTCESWNTKGNCQEWHNTTSKDKRERIALWNARWRILELLKTRHVLNTMFI